MTEAAAYRKIDRLLYLLEASADPSVHRLLNLLEQPGAIRRVNAVMDEVRRMDAFERTDFTTALLGSLEFDDDGMMLRALEIGREESNGSNSSE